MSSKTFYKWRNVAAAYGLAALWPKKKRPPAMPNATPTHVIELLLTRAVDLDKLGLDAGPVTIAWHLQHHHHLTVSRATIYRILRRADLVAPEPKIVEAELIRHCRTAIAGYKVPKSISFQSEPLPKSGPGKVLKRLLREP